MTGDFAFVDELVSHATSAPADRTPVRVARRRPRGPPGGVLRMGRLPVMSPHDSVTRPTGE